MPPASLFGLTSMAAASELLAAAPTVGLPGAEVWAVSLESVLRRKEEEWEGERQLRPSPPPPPPRTGLEGNPERKSFIIAILSHMICKLRNCSVP